MMMTREKMMDEFIRRYGFEDALTIQFCDMAEDKTVSMERLTVVFTVLTR